MPKAEWGVKRSCTSCGARFYDLLRDPVVCPSCGATVDITAVVKARRIRPGMSEKTSAKTYVDEDELIEEDEEDEEDEDEEVEADAPVAVESDDDDDDAADDDDEEAEVEVDDEDDLGEFDDDVLLDDEEEDDLEDVQADDIEKL